MTFNIFSYRINRDFFFQLEAAVDIHVVLRYVVLFAISKVATWGGHDIIHIGNQMLAVKKLRNNGSVLYNSHYTHG